MHIIKYAYIIYYLYILYAYAYAYKSEAKTPFFLLSISDNKKVKIIAMINDKKVRIIVIIKGKKSTILEIFLFYYRHWERNYSMASDFKGIFGDPD